MLLENALKAATAGTGQNVDFSGVWKNQLGSSATISQRNGVLSGIYESTVSSGQTSTKGDLSGFVDGDLISFTVHWRDFQAITAWVGQMEPNRSELKTLWQMVKQVTQTQEWSSINAGADVFHLTPP